MLSHIDRAKPPHGPRRKYNVSEPFQTCELEGSRPPLSVVRCLYTRKVNCKWQTGPTFGRILACGTVCSFVESLKMKMHATVRILLHPREVVQYHNWTDLWLDWFMHWQARSLCGESNPIVQRLAMNRVLPSMCSAKSQDPRLTIDGCRGFKCFLALIIPVYWFASARQSLVMVPADKYLISMSNEHPVLSNTELLHFIACSELGSKNNTIDAEKAALCYVWRDSYKSSLMWGHDFPMLSCGRCVVGIWIFQSSKDQKTRLADFASPYADAHALSFGKRAAKVRVWGSSSDKIISSSKIF